MARLAYINQLCHFQLNICSIMSWFKEQLLRMGYYSDNLTQGKMEMILPEGHQQENAPLRWNNVALGRYNFHFAQGQGSTNDILI